MERKLADLAVQVGTVLDYVTRLRHEMRSVMATLDQITDAVTRQETVEASIITLVQALAQEVRDLGSQETVDPADVLALADRIDAGTASLQAAVTANPADQTPPADTPPADGGTGTDTAAVTAAVTPAV